jgi:hypothetical protein
MAGITDMDGASQMVTNTLEERVSLLDRDVVQLKRQLHPSTGAPWWEEISGEFAEVPAFGEVVDFGRRFREAQRPAADEETDVAA